MREYQEVARQGGEALRGYLEKYIFSCSSFEEYLEKIGGVKKLNELRREMMKLV